MDKAETSRVASAHDLKMKISKKDKGFMKGFILFYLLIFCGFVAEACTAVIISGKSTPDGRPILWKHRDTDNFQNAIKYFGDGKYNSIGLINSDDPEGREVWAGYNSAGFAIINTASYNLIGKDTVKLKDQEGVIMREALKVCATVGDFENFLRERAKPLGVEANFGVIDAKGGAAWYETDNFQFKKLDVNDPAVAPMGYLIHTNFSFTGDPKRGSGHIRYKTAEDLFYQAAQQNNLTVRFILQEVSRSLWHSLIQTDLKSLELRADEQKFVHFTDFIPRYSSTASVAIQGILPGEKTELTTMWTILGFPLTSVVFPVWLNQGNNQPDLLTLNAGQVAPLCDLALTLKKKVFPVVQNYGGSYLNLSVLYNEEESGLMQILKPLEDKIIEESLLKLVELRLSPSPAVLIPAFYKKINDLITAEFSRRQWK
jgi:hypothetical protein